MLSVPVVKPLEDSARDFWAEKPRLGNSLLVAVCCGKSPKAACEAAAEVLREQHGTLPVATRSPEERKEET